MFGFIRIRKIALFLFHFLFIEQRKSLMSDITKSPLTYLDPISRPMAISQTLHIRKLCDYTQ